MQRFDSAVPNTAQISKEQHHYKTRVPNTAQISKEQLLYYYST